MRQRILITGTVGESLPPPYAGIPKRALLLARFWKRAGNEVGLTFTQGSMHPDDLGANGEYFFQFPAAPNKAKRLFFMLRHAVSKPAIYISLLVEYKRVYRRLGKEGWLYAAYGVWIDGVIRRFKPTVVLVEAAIVQGFMASRVAKRHGIPVVIDTYAEMHDVAMNKIDNFGDYRPEYWRRYMEPIFKVIAPSRYCAQGPLKYLPREKVEMIYSGIEVAKYATDSAGDRAELRKEKGLPMDSFIVMAVGAFTPRKGHDQLIRALAKLKQDVAVVLCGAGDPGWLEDLAKESGVANRTFVYKGLSEHDLIRLYGAVDLYVDASNTPRACLGMSLTEAMAASLPTVAYDIGGLPEVVHDGVNGYLVPLDDVEKLAQAIDKIQRMTPAERREMGRRGLTIAQQLVDINASSQQMLRVLEEAVMSNRR